jgi:hypothetical protein
MSVPRAVTGRSSRLPVPPAWQGQRDLKVLKAFPVPTGPWVPPGPQGPKVPWDFLAQPVLKASLGRKASWVPQGRPALKVLPGRAGPQGQQVPPGRPDLKARKGRRD